MTSSHAREPPPVIRPPLALFIEPPTRLAARLLSLDDMAAIRPAQLDAEYRERAFRSMWNGSAP